MPRKRDIEAAIAAHNSTDDRGLQLLPSDAVRLLAVMFPRDDVCQRRLDDLAAKGFDRRTLPHLLRTLIHAGFLSKEPNRGGRGVPAIYRLHLPPQRQP